ncbi:MAG: TlpA family protein disulfide reductase [Candidatus Kariarchaeaceae archaeon]
MEKYIPVTLIAIILSLNVIPVQGYSIEGSYLNTDATITPYSSFEGKILLVEAFATWCSHCQDEHKELDKLWDEKNDSIEILSLAVASDDNLGTVENYLQDYPTRWDVGVDINGTFKSEYKIPGFPALLFFDSEGSILSCHIGERSFNDLSSDVNNIMDNPEDYRNNRESSCELDPLTQFLQSPVFIVLVFLGLAVVIYVIRKLLKSQK